jgi:hypothetical protein
VKYGQSAFPLHVEDFCAVSVNYVVKGVWKVWSDPKPNHNALFME